MIIITNTRRLLFAMRIGSFLYDLMENRFMLDNENLLMVEDLRRATMGVAGHVVGVDAHEIHEVGRLVEGQCNDEA